MWRTSSIFFQISILFAFAFVSFSVASLFYIRIQPGLETIQKYNIIVESIGVMRRHEANLNDIRGFLEGRGFHEVTLSESMKHKFHDLLESPMQGSFSVNVMQEQNDIFIALKSLDEIIIYSDHIEYSLTKYHVVTIIGSVILIFVYVILMNKLMPLNRIRREISAMTKSNTLREISYGSENQDEIGDIVREFNSTVLKVNSIGESRTLFLRSIMHELKTPITKGRIIAEMTVDERQKKILCRVFERLNSLIDEFAKIEQLVSKNYLTQKNEILLIDIIEEVKRILFIDEKLQGNIEVYHNNDLLKVDHDLFILSVKNLIDNAIKYSTDFKAIINVTKHDLIIKNLGEALKLDINEYFKPYFKNMKNPLSKGFGLGMYIIKSTLDAQNFGLEYKHKDGYNIFIIKNCIVKSFCALNDKHKYKNIDENHS